MSLLDQLKTMTVVVADTGDIQSIAAFKPQDTTTNPSLLAAAAQMPQYADIVRSSIDDAKKRAGGERKEVVALAIDLLSVQFGRRILDIVPGRVSTEVDARLSFDTSATLQKARSLIGLYEEAGIARERILIKIASTWEGIRAADVLEDEGIHTNLTLQFGLHQAIACAEAGVTLISPFVGRILDYYLKKTGRTSYPAAEDPGVVSVTRIYNYFKRHGYETQVMGASFRNTGEILELAGCDLLTISPKLLAELDKASDTADGPLVRKLDAERARSMTIEQIPMTEARFREMHAQDDMATAKLAEGIDGFTQAAISLEKQIESLL